MVKTAFLLSCLFMAGGVLGIYAGATLFNDSDPFEDVRTSATSRKTLPVVPPVTVDPAPNSLDGDAAPPVLTVASPEGSFSSLREALEAIPIPRYEAGKGKITGRVLTEDDEPIPGVRLRADASKMWERESSSARPVRDPGGVDLKKDLEKEVIDFVSNLYFEQATRREAFTNAKGYFKIAGLDPSLRWTVEAFKTHWEIDSAPGAHRHDEIVGSDIDFVGKPVISIPVDIRFVDGRQPYKAKVYWTRGNSSSSERWYPHAPRIQLRPGTYSLQVKAGDESEFASAKQEVTLDQEFPAPKLTFELNIRPGVRGRLLFPEGEAPSNARVYLTEAPDEIPGDSEKLDQLLTRTSGVKNAYVRSRDGFTFAFKDLAEGTYLLGASRGGRRIAAHTLVEVSGLLVDHDLEIPALSPDEYVVVRIFGPDGEPVDDASVSVSNASFSSSTRKADGSLWVFFDPQRQQGVVQQAPTYTLHVSSKSLGQRQIPFTPGTDTAIDVEFTQPGELEVVVDGYAGSGYEGRLRVVIQRIDPAPSSPPTGTPRRVSFGGRGQYISRGQVSSSRELGRDGRVTIGPLESGEYTIRLQLRSERRGYRYVQTVEMTVRPGKNLARLSMPALYSLVVATTLSASSHVNISSNSRDSGSRYSDSQRTDENGAVSFVELPAGEYTISSFGGGSNGQMRVTLPGPLEVAFDPQIPNAMRFTPSAPGSPLAAAGFQNGDVLVGVDGTEFENQSQMQTLIAAAMVKKTTTFLVDRGGRLIEISVDRESLKKSGSLWSHFKPIVR